jgi:glycosyltransferase involved in cell wall biosynthesis
MRAESGWLYPVRKLGGLLDSLLGSTRNARLILTATAATRAAIASRFQAKCVSMLENGVDIKLFTAAAWPPPPSPENPLQILFVGRLLPFKGVAMLLEAVARLAVPFRLTVIGAGSEQQVLREQAEALGLEDRVEFTGGLPLAEVARHMAAAHVFCLPSVRESGGAVLLEAMAAAKPIIALAYGGPAEIVDEEVGRLLPSTGREAAVAGIAKTLAEIAADPEPWRERGLAGRRRVEQRYAWDVKIDAAIALYRQCLETL